jgi:diacylglycerol kinase (ATP)
MSVCVIFNPAAGRRRAQSRLKRFLAMHRDRATLRPTEYAGHAVELARQAALDGFATVAAAGGDGTAHDVANGLLQAGADAVFAVVPIGSANDYAHSVARQFGTSELADGPAHPVDVGVVRAAGRERYFIECAGLGLVARVTIEAQAIPRLQGFLLYGLAAWRALKRQTTTPVVELSVDGGPWDARPRQAVSVLIGRREGNFLLAPQAILDDGLFDYGDVGTLGRWEAMRMLPGLAVSGPPTDHPEIRLGRCRSIAVRSHEPLPMHTDGELFSTADDGLSELTIELLPKRLCVKVCMPG